MRSKQLLAIVCVISAWIGIAQSQTPAPPPLSPTDRQIAEAFEKRAKDYSKMREALEEKMPKLSKEAKPEEIQAHKTQFQERVRNARLSAKRGDLLGRLELTGALAWVNLPPPSALVACALERITPPASTGLFN